MEKQHIDKHTLWLLLLHTTVESNASKITQLYSKLLIIINILQLIISKAKCIFEGTQICMYDLIAVNVDDNYY